MAKKRKKNEEVRVRLTEVIHERLRTMADRRGIPMASLATFYVTKALELDEGTCNVELQLKNFKLPHEQPSRLAKKEQN